MRILEKMTHFFFHPSHPVKTKFQRPDLNSVHDKGAFLIAAKQGRIL